MKLYVGGRYKFKRSRTDWAVFKIVDINDSYYRAEVLDAGENWGGSSIGEQGHLGKNSPLMREYTINRLDEDVAPKGKTDGQVADALIIYLEIKGNIDRALINGDKDLFMNLTSSLKELEEMGVFA